MRLIPALALIAAVPASYLAFRRMAGERAALATALFSRWRRSPSALRW
jgi:hypothetical protein